MKASKQEIFNYIMDRNKILMDQSIWSLRDWLTKCAISVTDLSLALGIGKSHLSRLMKGKRRPSPQLMEHILVITNGKIRDEEDLIDPF